jgi:hypothetical protein
MKKKVLEKNSNSFKQMTFDSPTRFSEKKSFDIKLQINKRQIILNEIDTILRDDELIVKIGFSLSPSKASFSRIKCDLFFNSQPLKRNLVAIPQSQILTNDFELTPIILDMKGLDAGIYTIRVDLCELLPLVNGTCSSREITVRYFPSKKEVRYIKIPIVKRFEGEALEVMSEFDKNIYRDINQTIKKELASKQDEW